LIQINDDRQFTPQLKPLPFRERVSEEGTVKQVAGKAVGDAKLEAEGNADKIEGQVQNAIGGVKDTLKGK